MPYPNEHAARIENPDNFKIFAGESKDKKKKSFPNGIRPIYAKKDASSPMILQALRFDKTKFTPAEAKKWLKDHKQKYMSFEEASES